MVRAALRAAKSSEFPRLRGCRTMSDDTRGRGDRAQRRPRKPPSPRGSSVSANGSTSQVASRSAETGSASRPATDHSGFARGFRLSSELVAGVLVGAGTRLADRQGARDLAVGDVRVRAARLYGRRAERDAAGGSGIRRRSGLDDRTPQRSSAATAHRGRRDRPVMADPIHQFQINKIFTIGHDRRARDRIHQLVAVHGDRGRDHRRRCWSARPPRAASCRAGCNRSPSSPTSSSPRRYEVPPAARG